MKPSGDTNYYGLVFGGHDLDGPQQNDLYSRGGAERYWVDQTPQWRCQHGDHRGQDAKPCGEEARRERQVHQSAPEVRVAADKVDFAANGVVVKSLPKTGTLANTDGGIYAERASINCRSADRRSRGYQAVRQLLLRIDGRGSEGFSFLSRRGRTR